MGLLKKIGKAIGSVFSGIKKVFRAVMKPINKILGSKWGKILMTALSIFTLGTALLAGGAEFLAVRAAGSSYISSFVAGGKAFIGSLLGIEPTQQTAAGAPGASGLPPPVSGVGGGVTPQDIIASPTTPAAGVAAPQITPKVSYDMGGKNITQFGNTVANVEKPGNWLSKAAAGALEFAKTPSGGTIIGAMITGIGESINQKNQNEFDSRIERQFADSDDPGLQRLQQHDFSVNAPRGLAAAPGRLAQAENARSGRFQPTVPFRGLPAIMPPGGG